MSLLHVIPSVLGNVTIQYVLPYVNPLWFDPLIVQFIATMEPTHHHPVNVTLNLNVTPMYLQITNVSMNIVQWVRYVVGASIAILKYPLVCTVKSYVWNFKWRGVVANRLYPTDVNHLHVNCNVIEQRAKVYLPTHLAVTQFISYFQAHYLQFCYFIFASLTLIKNKLVLVCHVVRQFFWSHYHPWFYGICGSYIGSRRRRRRAEMNMRL